MAIISGIKQAIRELLGISSGEVENVMNSVRSELQKDTPKDTGFAASQWKVGRSPGSGSKISTGYDITKGDLHITNSTEYINKLNAGSSTQAPSGFIEIAIEVGAAKGKSKK